MTKKRLGIPLLIAIGLLLTAVVVYADMFTTEVVDAWDIGANPPQYAHSLVAMVLDESWIPFWHKLRFDNDLYDYTVDFPYLDQLGNTIYYTDVGGCVAPAQTAWEGMMDYAQYHEDNSPAGAHAFMATRNWELVDCDRDFDGDFDGGDLKVTPAYSRTTLAATTGSDWIYLVEQDREDTGECGGNCLTEIITTLFVTLDHDCDGQIDSLYDPITVTAGVCFYAEAQTANSDLPIWKGNPQARITAGGGQKTVNFHVETGTTDITLGSLTATWVEERSQSVILGAAIAVVAAGTLGALIWRLRPVRR
ncbi:MAG TPA: hypothetical protein VMW58_15330 [Anaerolineae bacterium]|nr:hypothetical protein [Anaerolineae bacterium]